jgi:predicted RND superfamily exporter protein
MREITTTKGARMKLPDPLQLPKTRFARARTVLLLAGVCFVAGAPAAQASVEAPAQANIQQASPQQGSAQQTGIQQGSTSQGVSAEKTGTSLESAAAKAGDTARTVAMSLIGLALAIASIVLAFRRDFKEAAGVFAVGIVAVLLATPAGLSLLQDTVTSLFGS